MNSVSRPRKPVNLCKMGGIFGSEMKDPCERASDLSNSSSRMSNVNLPEKPKKEAREAKTPKVTCTGTYDCSHCVNERKIVLSYMRREISHVQLEEDQLVWSELREHVLYLYKTLRESTVGPTVVGRVKHLVDRLCEKDPHQLYLRLEILATEVVKQSLESVERIFVNELRNSTIAHNYLENIIADCDNLLFAARKMTPMLRNLQKHLKEFNICWVLLHQNLFRIHYLEDVRCKIRAKRARLLLLKDIEIPAFTETILKFSQFVEALNGLTDHWVEATTKLQKYTEIRDAYRNSRLLLREEWQNMPKHPKTTKASLETTNTIVKGSKETKSSLNAEAQVQEVACGTCLPTQPVVAENCTQNTTEGSMDKMLTKSQAKKARRKAKADHRRQPSADLMPPPPPRTVDTTELAASVAAMRLDPVEHPPSRPESMEAGRVGTRQRLRDTLRKKNEPVKNVPFVNPPAAGVPASSDNRDVDELVRFVEGVKIEKIDDGEKAKKKNRKKLKKENQKMKKMQTLIEQDQVAQLIKRSPEVTITMIKPTTTVCEPPPNKNNQTRAVLKAVVPERCPIVAQKAVITPPPSVKGAPPSTAKAAPPAACGANPGARMVTIRRINEANTDEPTVTITLKGATPDQDQVLYRIINGQADYGHIGDNAGNVPTNNNKSEQKLNETSRANGAIPKCKKKSGNAKRRGKTDVCSDEGKPPSSDNDSIVGTRAKRNPKENQAVKKLPMQSVPNSSKYQSRKVSVDVSSSEEVDFSPVKFTSGEKQPFIVIKKKRKKSEPSERTPQTSPIEKNSTVVERSMISTKTTKCPVEKSPKITNQKMNSQKIVKPKALSQKQLDKQVKAEFHNQIKARNESKQIQYTKDVRGFELRPSAPKQEQCKIRNEYFENRQKPTPIFCSPPPAQQKFVPKSYSEWDNDTDASKLIPENLRLPAGITITKVPSTNTKRSQYDQQDARARNMTLDTSRQSFAESVLKNKADLPPDVTIVERNIYAPPPIFPPAMHSPPHMYNPAAVAEFEITTANRQPPIGTGMPRPYEPTARFFQTPDGRVTIRGPMMRPTTPPLNPLNMIRQDIEMGVHSPPLTCWARSDWWPPGGA